MKKEILAEEVNQIIQQSFWGKGGVRLTESAQEPQAQEQVEEEVPVEEEQLEEAVEAHVCPLCESQLEGAISDEQLAEHVDFMVGIINEMEDISDDDLTELAEELVSEEGAEDEEMVEGISLQKPLSLQKRPSGSYAGGPAEKRLMTSRPGQLTPSGKQQLAQASTRYEKATAGRLPRPGDAPGNF